MADRLVTGGVDTVSPGLMRGNALKHDSSVPAVGVRVCGGCPAGGQAVHGRQTGQYGQYRRRPAGRWLLSAVPSARREACRGTGRRAPSVLERGLEGHDDQPQEKVDRTGRQNQTA
ncbi:hypothetical protein GCM10020367_56360 [Streptomyces sannanensis]|uniref:Uncharacterized protein n=1 Tax=Streptomyces sannanensis TaxID=285536 RepID=A0ABP6SJH1_9ACTN